MILQLICIHLKVVIQNLNPALTSEGGGGGVLHYLLTILTTTELDRVSMLIGFL